MSTSTSSTSDLKKLIESENPFDRSLSVRSHDVWERSFPDVPSINSHVSNAIFQGIEQIHRGSRTVLGITIKAERGLGKSHLISRVRHRIKEEGNCFFVYMSETDYGDLNKINSQFLNTLALSLRQKGNENVTQWQELAALLANQACSSNLSAQDLIRRFPGALAKQPKLIDKLTQKICQIRTDIKDPYVVQAIFWTLIQDREIFAVNWLSGRELAQSQADIMGLPIVRDEDRELRALNVASQILDLIGNERSIVICFDEVEPKATNSKGLTTPQVVALLGKDLYSKIKRGLLVMAIFPQTWAYQVKTMPQADSVIDRISEKVLELRYLNSDDIVALVSFWLEDFYKYKGLTPTTPTYPFDENELRELGKEKPIIRKVLGWCRDNWKVSGEDISAPVLEDDLLHAVEVAFNEQLLALNGKSKDYLENSELLVNALWLGFASLVGQTISQVQIQQIEEVETSAADRGYISFRIVGKEKRKTIKIGVSVLQASSAKYVSAGLKRLIDYKKFDLTRGCLVRSKAVKPHTKGGQYLNTLLSELGGEWVSLEDKDIQPLLAIWLVYVSREEYEITEEQILEFIQKRGVAESNYIIQEILSNPSGQIPDNVVDEDQILTSVSVTPSDVSEQADELLTALSA